TRDWLQPLIKAMSLPGVGVAGPQLRYPNGMLQAAGSLVFRNAMTSRYGDGDPDPDSQVYQYPRMVDYVSGACLLIDRELFERLGGFDPIFGLGYFEDVDLCFKVAALDYRVLYVARSVVHHVRDASGGSRTLVDTVARNHRLFEERWHDVLLTRPVLGRPSDQSTMLCARDIRAPLRILLVGSAIRRATELLQYDCRFAITIAGCYERDLSEQVEVVQNHQDW